ncbi:MAG: Lrp/AsnC family transcriptional regulator [Desulfobacca sp.]|nr:Lrp/AsnC family transcriptional regulator [Desulfobacca sp.]
MLTASEKRIIRALQIDLEVRAQPFLPLAESLGLSETELLAAIRDLMARGYIRRFGATIRHRISGFDANAMVAWAVPPSEINRVGQILAGYREVTHCYERQITGNWPYNLFTMIHARTQSECQEMAQRMAELTGIKDYELLFSDVELKKTTMRYFRDHAEDTGELPPADTKTINPH